MAHLQRPESQRLQRIAQWLDDHPEVDAPTITATGEMCSVSWHLTSRPVMEAAVLAIASNWKALVNLGPLSVLLQGYHADLGQLLLTTDRYRSSYDERDWLALGVVPIGRAS